MIMHTNITKRKSGQKKMKKIYQIKYGSYVRTLFNEIVEVRLISVDTKQVANNN